MRFVVDENLPGAVADRLRRAGHEVSEVVVVLGEGTPDPGIVAYADDLGAVIVTDDRDFCRLVCRRPAGNMLRHRRAGRILMSCNERRAPGRLSEALPLIEWEAVHLAARADARVIVEVGGDVIRIER